MERVWYEMQRVEVQQERWTSDGEAAHLRNKGLGRIPCKSANKLIT